MKGFLFMAWLGLCAAAYAGYLIGGNNGGMAAGWIYLSLLFLLVAFLKVIGEMIDMLIAVLKERDRETTRD